jgi:ABC-type sugar transport system substrate-binding protein
MVILLVGAGCSGKDGNVAKGTKPIKLGITLLFRTDDWSVDIERSMKRVGDELGMELIFGDSEGNSAKMVQLAEDFISMGVDGVVSMAPANQATVDSILDVCQQAKKPLFLIDSSVENYDGVTAYTTCDAYREGELIGEWIVAYVKENLPNKKNINVAAIDYFPSEICKIRTDGCLNKLKAELPNFKEVSRQDGNANRADSMSVMENILTANNNDVDFAVSIAGWDATAGVKAAVEAVKAPTKVLGVAWGEECCLTLEAADPTVSACLLGLPSDMAKILYAADNYFKGKLAKPQVEYSYVMADHKTIFDIDWRTIKGISK